MNGAEVRVRRFGVLSQTVQTQNMFDLTIAGNTVGVGALVSSGTLTLVGGTNITLSQLGGNAITISGSGGHNVTLAGNSTSAGAGFIQISTGTMTIAGGNNITLSQNGNAVTIVGGAGGAGTTFSAGVSNLSNDSGQTGTVTNQIVFAGGNNITLSQASNIGGSATVTIIGPNTVAQSIQSYNILAAGTQTANTTGTVVFSNSNNVSFGMSNSSIVTATATFAQSAEPRVISLNGTSGSLSLSGASNITVSALNGSTITIYGPANILNSFSIGGNTGTTGSSNITGGGFVFAGGSNITLSQSNATISIHGGAGAGGAATGNLYLNLSFRTTATVGRANTDDRSLFVFPLNPRGGMPFRITANTFYFNASMSGSTATMSDAFTTTINVGLYTVANSSLNLINSVQTTFGMVASSDNSNFIAGRRFISIHSSLWSSQPVFSEGVDYYIAYQFSSSSVSLQTFSLVGMSIFGTAAFSGTLGVNSASQTWMNFIPFYGVYTALTIAFPATIANTELRITGANIPFMPLIEINNLIDSF